MIGERRGIEDKYRGMNIEVVKETILTLFLCFKLYHKHSINVSEIFQVYFSSLIADKSLSGEFVFHLQSVVKRTAWSSDKYLLESRWEGDRRS